MPLARIDLVQGKSAEYRRAIGGVVYEAMVDVLKAPKDDRFQVIAEHPADAPVAGHPAVAASAAELNQSPR